MARLFLSPNETTGVTGFSTNEVFGTVTGNETVNVTADGKAVFDASFNKGGDVINIAGNAGLYQAAREGSNIVLTASNGANIVIPIGTVGVTINFADAARVLKISGSSLLLGSQAIPADGTVVDVTDGSGSGGGDTGGGAGSTINLTVGMDDLTGTSGTDLFRARVGQNSLGEQTNQLGSGDILDGAGGNDDRLLAVVQAASPLNAGPGSSIAPETVDVEIAHFTARETGVVTGPGRKEHYEDGPDLGVEINAQDMLGLNEVGSLNSDESLTIYNMNTLTDSGLYEDRRPTSSITVCMDHTDNGDLVEPAADLTVLFDQDYLIPGKSQTGGAQLRIEIMDMDAAIANSPDRPLKDNVFGMITFYMGSELKELNFGSSADTYAELLADIRQALANHPDAAVRQLTADFGTDFRAEDTDDDPVVDGFAFGRSIVITNPGPETLRADKIDADGPAPAGNDYHTRFTSVGPDTDTPMIEVNVCLNKVGRGADGGDLTIGGMATSGGNVWGEGNGALGVEQFNVTVEGDATQFSSVASMQSTNNQLRAVFVESAAGSTADLILGNSVTNSANGFRDRSDLDLSTVRNNALKDVLVFDSTAFVNDATVWAHFSNEFLPKYLFDAWHDTDSNFDLDDVDGNARYAFGVGNDTLNMNVDKSNFWDAGTATREDFHFTADMGAGNDLVQFQIGDGFNALSGEAGMPTNNMYRGRYSSEGDANDFQTADNWYVNHVINGDLPAAGSVANLFQNVRIDTGDGNDTVETWGATAADINLGNGNDNAFTDNSGLTNNVNSGRATWVLNQNNNNVNDLRSQVPVAVTNVANLQLTVTYQGITRTVDVGGSSGSNGVTITDLSINQAIKAAINNDRWLSEVLHADDGPGRTLVVRSLIDGEHVEADFGIKLTGTALTAAQISAGAKSLVGTGANLLDLSTLGFLATGLPGTALPQDRWDAEFALDGSTVLRGYDSININNNNVEGGAGEDLIVLSSNGVGKGIGVNSSTIGNSVETLDLNAPWGFDKVFNFTSAVSQGTDREQQTITFTGTATLASTATVSFNGVTVDVPVAAGDTPTVIANNVATALQTALGSTATAVASNGVVTLTGATAGVDILPATVSFTGTQYETITFTFSGIAETPSTFWARIDGVDYPVAIGGATTQTAQQVATAVAAAFNADNTPGTPASVGGPDGYTAAVTQVGDAWRVVLTPDDATPGNLTVAGFLETSNSISLNLQVSSVVEPRIGTTAAVVTVTEGALTAHGYDIFDLTTIMGQKVSAVDNDKQVDGIEATSIQGVVAGNGIVAITDTVEADDFAFTTSPASELARIQEIATKADTATQTQATNGWVITVDGANVGHFYFVEDGRAVGDVKVTHYGDIQLAGYADASKDPIGNWDQMTLANFTPLNVPQLLATFDQIG